MIETPANSNHKLMTRVAWVGLIPLAMNVLYAWLGSPAKSIMLFVGFSAVVLAFVVGSFWGQVLIIDSKDRELRPVIFVTALVSITAWTALILAFTGEPLWALVALLAGYMLSYTVENQSLAQNQASWYRQMRFMLTGAVALLHGLMIVLFFI